MIHCSMTVYVQIGYKSGGKACCDWLSCAVMWPLGPADLVDNGGVRGEISYELLCRPFTIRLHYCHLLSFSWCMDFHWTCQHG